MTHTSDLNQSAEASQTAPHAPRFPLVGLGASAGGIKALQAFFEAMPGDSGMAFVVIMHLAPDHESNLTQIMQQRTTMPVLQVIEPVPVAPNQVYVIPPGKHLSLQGDLLQPVEPQQPSGRRIAIDLFFRSLSVAFGPRAISIVLSGGDSDGTIGIKHVKEQGGLTIAQDLSEAEFDSMPRSAISTGMVDWILPVAQMPPQLMEFLHNEQRMHIPPEEHTQTDEERAEDRNSGGPPAIRHIPRATDETALAEVLRLLRGHTGHDFAHYKRATILRRVARRLQVNLLEDIPAYLDFLRTHPMEMTALLRDLLISVTNFFRDSDAFAALESHLPQLFVSKTARDQLRVWVAGCATGEEAYTVAMLLCEQAGRLDSPPAIQVFATDLDEDVIQVARAGLYPATIEADVSPERLRRFFHKDDGRYRIKKEVRERVLFSAHNLLKDSPFSRLDLITCRNLLIYLKHEAQEAVLDLFHFALRSGGLLFLGSSENVADGHALFAPLDKRLRLFVRRSASQTGLQLSALALPSPSPPVTSAPVQPATTLSSLRAEPAPVIAGRRAPLLGDLHLAMLEQFAPPSVILNANHDIVHLTEHAMRFLQLAGEASLNLLKVVHPALRLEVRTALFRASRSQTNVTTSPIPLEREGKTGLVTIHIRPILMAEADEGFILVVFEPAAEPVEAPPGSPSSSDTLARHLGEENQHLKDQLSATVEQYEASLEELKSSNEELQSMNEEARATAEELETSKEELQSINEELTTVNQELKSNMEEVSRVNADLQNLMASTEIGTIFLDRQLCIKRFTPRVQDLFNIISTDIGRPLSDITHKLNYHHFTEDAEQVLGDLYRCEREVRSNGQWFLARLLPYRTLDDRIDGVVLTFVDITERKRAEAANAYLAAIVEASEEAIVGLSPEGVIESWNPSAERLFGFSAAEAVGQPISLLGGAEDAQRVVRNAMRTGQIEQQETVRYTKDHHPVTLILKVAPVLDKDLQVVGVSAIFNDITERKRAESEQREMELEAILWQERSRIGRELHDTLAQAFTAIKMQLDVADADLEAKPAAARANIVRARQIAQESLQEVRRVVRALRSAPLEAGGLIAACEQMVWQVSQGTGIAVSWAVEGEVYSLPESVESELFRIAQEAFTNALRHAQAKQIEIRLRYAPSEVALRIADNGKGFDTQVHQEGYGIRGMQERAERIGGVIHLNSKKRRGTELLVTLPTTAF